MSTDKHSIFQLSGFLRKNFFRTSINRRILLYLLLFSSVITLFLVALRLYKDYQNDLTFITYELRLIERYSQPAISRALWKFDEHLVQSLLDAIIESSHTDLVKVISPTGKTMYSVGAELDKAPDKVIPLSFYDTNLEVGGDLGSLHLFANYDYANTALRDRFLFTLMAQGAKTFLVSLFLLLLVHTLITRHLKFITDALTRFGRPGNFAVLLNKDKPIQLKRDPIDDEIEALVDGLNNYQAQINQQLLVIKDQNKQLNVETKSRQQAEEDRAIGASLVRKVFDLLHSGIFIVDHKQRIINSNRLAKDQIGLEKVSLIGKPVQDFVFLSEIEPSLADKNSLPGIIKKLSLVENIQYCQYGRRDHFKARVTIDPIIVKGRSVEVYAIVIENESERLRLELEQHQATHDYLTGLYNRLFLDSVLEARLNASKLAQAQHPTSLAFVDLDKLKTINDVFGHRAGDQVLISVAHIIKSVLKDADLVARQGGDEFIVVSSLPVDQFHAELKLLVIAIARYKFNYMSEVFHVSCSIGLAEADYSRDTVNSFISKADAACYRAKDEGGNVAIIYHEGFEGSENKIKDFYIVNCLREAVLEDRLLLYSQSIIPVDSESNLPVREEILARYENNQTIVKPAEFMDAMMRSRQMSVLDQAVMRNLIKKIEDLDLKDLHLNVNLSPTSLLSNYINRTVTEFLSICNDRNISVYFEITEDAMIEHRVQLLNTLHVIKSNHGFIAVDDFGKGFASFGSLKELEVDMIKIDGSIIAEAGIDSKVDAIISSICSIADSINALVVAEHVQNHQQRNLLKAFNINYSQSYLDALPKPFYPQNTAENNSV